MAANLERIQQLTQDAQEAETNWRQHERKLNSKENKLRIYIIVFWPAVISIFILLQSELALIPLAIAGLMMLGYLAERSKEPDVDVLRNIESQSHDRYEDALDALTRELMRDEFA